MAIPGFGARAVESILDGYLGRRVYNQNDLILALGDPNVRRVVIAQPFEITQALSVVGGDTVGAGVGRTISGSIATPLTVNAAIDHVFSVVTGCIIEGIWLKRGADIAAGDVGAFVVNGGAYSEFVRVRDCIVSDACAKAINCTTADADSWQVTDNNFIGANVQPNIYAASATAWLVSGNAFDDGITLAGGSSNRVCLNDLRGSNITTSATSGGNVLYPNVRVGTVTAHASDIYVIDPTAATDQALNT